MPRTAALSTPASDQPGVEYRRKRWRNKDIRVQVILDAASAVFAEKGYDAARWRDIARQAGCSEGLIHHYFKNKRALFLMVVSSTVDQVFERSIAPPAATVAEEIEHLITWQLNSNWRRKGIQRIWLSRVAIDEDFASQTSEFNRQRIEAIVERLAVHQQAGRIKPNANLEAAAYLIMSSIIFLGAILQTSFKTDERHVREIALGCVEVLRNALETA